MRALIIANGTHPSLRLVRKILNEVDIIICADGGANYARKQKITPDIIIGDFDSITEETRNYFADIKQLHIKDQYSTDLEKAIAYCIKKKYYEVIITGAFGSRVDHTTGSLGCFKKFHDKIHIVFIDNDATVSRIDKSIQFHSTAGEKISLIPLDRCTGVTTQNLRYPLKNDVLEIGVREGISNEATDSTVSIKVKKGTLLLYRFHNQIKN